MFQTTSPIAPSMSAYDRLYSMVLAKLDPEFCHDMVLNILRVVGASDVLCRLLASRFSMEDERLTTEAFGLRFSNPLGLAAGYDKNAIAVRGLAGLGFGFIEIGTVTPSPQPGNPRPRIFRLFEDAAIINRQGFPNVGCEQVRRNLLRRARPPAVVVGASIGKGVGTPIERANEDYLRCLSVLYDCVDYFAINVSSPNTPGLRALQAKEMFEDLVRSAIAAGNDLAKRLGCVRRPLLAKISPDLSLTELEALLEVALACELSGVIVCNTTVARPDLTSPRRDESGGLSGRPIKGPSTQLIREVYKRVGRRLPIIGSGGIFSAEDAWEKLAAGASLLQAYTGLVYKGPGFARRILQGLLQLMEQRGLKRIDDVVGIGDTSHST